ncbi:substrate-binding periplasmic protein [Thalassotalea insulae]
MPWSRALKEVQKSTFDGAFAVWYTHERNEQFLLSSPYLTEDLVFIKSKANEISYDGDLSKLRDVTIGVVTGWTISPEFDSASYLNKYQVTSTEQLFEMLKQGRIDLVATSLQMYKGFNDKNQKDTFKKYINEFDVLANKLGSLSSHVAFPKSSPKSNLFKKSFEQGLKKIFLNKKLAKIEQKFGYKTGLPCY